MCLHSKLSLHLRLRFTWICLILAYVCDSYNRRNDIIKQTNILISRFDSLQVKRDLISSIINFVYELSHELPNDLRLGILGMRKYRKISKLGEGNLVPSSLPEIKLWPYSKKLHKTRSQTFLFSSNFALISLLCFINFFREIRLLFFYCSFNPLMHSFPKWSDTL